jgi:hypothetical protein
MGRWDVPRYPWGDPMPERNDRFLQDQMYLKRNQEEQKREDHKKAIEWINLHTGVVDSLLGVSSGYV